MKQKKLVEQLYRACLEHDKEEEKKLLMDEMIKIFKRKQNGKNFGANWTVI